MRDIFTGAQLAATGVNGIPTAWLLPDIKTPTHPPMAIDRVRHVGEPVAVVIADNAYVARDAAELVSVDYEVLPAVVDTATASTSATLVHDGAPENRCFHWAIGDAAATDAAFANAAHVVKQHLVNHRLAAVAMEPRSALASYSRGTDELTLWVTSQNPHVHRLIMGAFVLGIPEHKFRVIAPDVGGGFGSKIFIYPEECVVAWATKQLARPVKWTATRSVFEPSRTWAHISRSSRHACRRTSTGRFSRAPIALPRSMPKSTRCSRIRRQSTHTAAPDDRRRHTSSSE